MASLEQIENFRCPTRVHGGTISRKKLYEIKARFLLWRSLGETKGGTKTLMNPIHSLSAS